MDTTNDNVVVNLPIGQASRQYKIINTSVTNDNIVSIIPNGSELLFGENETFTLYKSEIIDIIYTSSSGWW